MSDSFTGRVAIVSGAGNGIGRATTALFASHGARVFAVDIDADAVAQTARNLGDAVTPVHVDVSSEEDVRELMNSVARDTDRLDVIANIAGIQRSGAVAELDVESWDLTFAVNVRSCFLMAKYGTRIMRDGGAIVNIASAAALKGYPGMTAYSASKGAIISFTRTLASEVADKGIRVNCLAPGWVDTPFNNPAIANMGGREAQDESVRATVLLKRQSSPDEMAKTIYFLASDESSYMTGQTVVADGGMA